MWQDSVRECDIELDDAGSIRKSVCWIFKRKVRKRFNVLLNLNSKMQTSYLFKSIVFFLQEDEARYWASKEQDKSGDKIYFVGDIFSPIPSRLAIDMQLAVREKISMARSFKKIIADSYNRKVLLFDVGHSRARQELSEVIRQKFRENP